MTPAARVQTAIEILDAVAAAARGGGAPADAIVADALRQRRYAGAKDRRALRDLIYRAIRAVRSVPPTGRAAFAALADGDAGLAALFDGSAYGPAALSADEPRAVLGIAAPALLARLDSLVDAAEWPALLARAPLDLRINRAAANPVQLAMQLPEAQPIAGLANGLRLAEALPVTDLPGYADGWFEVQDAASQFAAAAAAAAVADVPAPLVIDLCAGAGGKTLALAAALPDARLIATDTNRARLQQLPPRAARAGAAIATRLLNPGQEAAMLADVGGRADMVLVDAPCSGSGTWRRAPELRWRISPSRLAALMAQQAALLDLAAGLVRPGGTLVYAVCSLIGDEGRGQIATFLDHRRDWRAAPPLLPPTIARPCGPGALLTPHHDGCDGFFVASLIAP